MSRLKKKIIIVLDLEHLPDAPIFGTITDKLICGELHEAMGLIFQSDIDTDIGEFYCVTGNQVFASLEEFANVFGTNEKRIQELEAEGMTRSDAQACADAEEKKSSK